MSKQFDVLNYADAIAVFFDEFCKNAKLQQLEKIIGANINIRTIPVSDYKFELSADGIHAVSAELPFGDMTFKFSLEEMPSWTARQYIQKSLPPPDSLLVQVYYRDVWIYRHIFLLDPAITRTAREMWVEYTYSRIFMDIKRKASVTLREAKKYLANPAYYDMLEKELNIKQRKLKKR